MLTLTRLLPDAPTCRPRLRRLADDLGMTIIVCAWVAVLVTLVGGRPEELYREMVGTTCVGVIALAIVDGVRLVVWNDAAMRRRWMLAYLALIVATAPVAHYLASVVVGLFFGNGWLGLAAYLQDRRQPRGILMTLLGICAVALMIVNRERIERIKVERQDARTRADAVERQALQTQLRLLQAQIEPHMLFNTLANLQGLIAIDPRRAATMVDHLIQYLRATLSATRLDTTTLGQEFDAIDAYLGLMAVRMGARLRYRCSLPDALRGARVPPMLLQPLVENAIIHGLEPHIDGGSVTVEAASGDGLLTVSVCDTGPGLDAGRTGPKGDGVGVATTRERLRALYGARAALDLVPASPHGALARVTLPLETA